MKHPQPSNPGLPELVARQAASTPLATAVDSVDGTLTYKELDRQADLLARALRARGVCRDDIVAVCLPRRLCLVVALLGVMRAHAAFLPLDPAHPADRLGWMLADSQARLLLVDDQPPLDPVGVPVLRFADVPATADGEPATVWQEATDPEGLAYVMYTSGSTGRPKGVAVVHRGIHNRVRWAVKRYGFAPTDRMLQKTALTFDASVWEFFGPLISGGTVVLAPDGAERDPALMAEVLVRERITVLQGVPTFLRLLANEPSLERCRSLRLLFSAGEPLPDTLATQLTSRLPVTLVNTYGPTECSIDVSSWEFDGPGTGTVPIGRPLTGIRAEVLCPAGTRAETGELYVSGVGLARGYLGNPRLTADRFVPDLYGPPGSRAYRTGDTVRRRADGVLEFVGRMDHQVKIRGIRVEPGEAETVLSEHPAVAAAIVLPRPGLDGQPRLVGYVVPRGAAPEPRDLRTHLLDRLPEVYVPSSFVTLDRFPTVANGKIDLRALPAPERVRGDATAEPSTPAEKTVARALAEVLGLDAVGADDDFFALGGHSLLAIQVAGKLRTALGVDVPVRTVLEARTVTALAEQLTHLAVGTTGAIEVLPAQERSGPVPLSFSQQRLWFLDRLHPGSGEYHATWAFRLMGPLDTEGLGAAVNDLVARHEVLRTRYVTGPDGVPVQLVSPPSPVPLPLTQLAAGQSVERVISSLAEEPFDLSARAPARWHLLRTGTDEHVFVLLMHHIVTDDWTEDILARELSELYRSRATGRPSALRPPHLQYPDFAVWQRTHLSGSALDTALAYWRGRLNGLQPLELPTDRPRPGIRGTSGRVVREELPAETARGLLHLGRERGATTFMSFLCVFYALLGRYTGATDLAVGTVVAGRENPGLEDVAGCFVNTVVLRTGLADDPTPEQLIARVRDCVLDAFGHHHLPFDRLVEELAPHRDLARSPLIDVTFGVRELAPHPLRLDGLKVRPIVADRTTAKFDLSVILTARPDGGYVMELEYATDLFVEATVRRIARHFRALTTAMATAPTVPLSRLSMLGRKEREQLLHGWDPPQRTTSPECAHEVFAAQSVRTPDAVAVAGDGEHLTYADVAARADALARRLVAAGTPPESPVAVLLDRSPAAVPALLAVLRASGAYAPLDPAQPIERLAQMLEGLRPSVVVTDRRTATRLGELPAPLVLVDAVEEAPPVELPAGDPDRLAYVLHTSGSTGRPKAVMVSHRSLSHHLRVMSERLGYRSDDRVLLLAPLYFDPAMEQMLAPLLLGAAVVVGEPGLVPPAELPALIARAGVTQLAIAPHYYREVVVGLAHRDPRMATVRTLVVAGDVVTNDDARRWAATGLDAGFVAVYGPTEATVAALSHRAWQEDLDTGAPETGLPLGRPLPGVRAHILDARMAPVPVGVSGEIFLGGPRLARGYMGQPGITADRFVPDPYGTEPGARLYRTGDLGRFRGDGVIEFLGRSDAQVKIRGYRVELGEVEACLVRHPAVAVAAAAVQGAAGGERRLVGYVVPRPGEHPPSGAELRAHLRDRLPEYMVPTAFVTLAELPRGQNQKVDRKALPLPAPDGAEDELTAPRDEIEEAIAEAWATVLGVERVGVDQGFFDIGGHSLLATRLAARLQDVFGMEVPIRLLFEANTVAAQANALARYAEVGAPPAPHDPAVTRS
ncbi:hypothetical protein ADL21_00305 [Streptomyces albus subsp. albus]|nr:hypothetical protein ADL21_00305 [Streptomyces albus subsp. albus]